MYELDLIGYEMGHVIYDGFWCNLPFGLCVNFVLFLCSRLLCMNLRILLSNNHSDTLVLNMPLPQEVCVPLSPTLNPSHLWVFLKKKYIHYFHWIYQDDNSDSFSCRSGFYLALQNLNILFSSLNCWIWALFVCEIIPFERESHWLVFTVAGKITMWKQPY